jgi:peptide chain release factor 2
MENSLIEEKIKSLESQMLEADFWTDKTKADNTIKEIKNLKFVLNEEKEIDAGDATVSIIAGSGGDDSEDWAYMLYQMYTKFAVKNNFDISIIHIHNNEHGGIKNITFEIKGKGIFGLLKYENGVHRLVRISPFDANNKRHTSFALVEVLPILPDIDQIEIKAEDIEINFAKSGGPGGQNVNKRETAVRATYKPLDISVHVTNYRTQEQNRQRAIDMLKAKVYLIEKDKLLEDNKKYNITSNTNIEWGNQIRNYIMHPYKLIKDQRSGFETSNINDILDGDLLDMLNSFK